VLTIYDQVKNPQLWTEVAYNAADAYRLSGRCDRAVPILERIVKIADAGQAQAMVGAAATGALGSCQVTLGRIDAGIATYKSAIAKLDALGGNDFAAQYRLELAEAHWKRGDWARARALATKVKEMLPADSAPRRELLKQADDYYLHPKPGIRRK